MNVRFLETFYWFATLKSVTKTAQRLRVSQPVVSMRLATLQRDLGAELYHGIGKTFALTPAGRSILGKCEAIVALANDLEAELRDTLQGREVIRVGVVEIVALSWLPQFLAELEKAELSASIITGPSESLVAALRDGSIDFALTIAPLADPTLEISPICAFPIGWVASPTFFNDTPPQSVHDLARLPIIQSRKNTFRFRQTIEYFEWHGIGRMDGLKINQWIDVGISSMSSAYLASKNVGITAVPLAAVSDMLDTELLTKLDIPEEFSPWGALSVFRKTDSRVPTVKSTLACARQAALDYSRIVSAGRFLCTTS